MPRQMTASGPSDTSSAKLPVTDWQVAPTKETMAKNENPIEDIDGKERSTSDRKSISIESPERRLPMSAFGVAPPPCFFPRRERPGSLTVAPSGPAPANMLCANVSGAECNQSVHPTISQFELCEPQPVDETSEFENMLKILMGISL